MKFKKKANEQPQSSLWLKILVVDDEADVHRTTSLVLQDAELDGIRVECVSAYSAKQAKEILLQDQSFVLAIVDIVMETNQAGLELVDFIKTQLKSYPLQVILRTGQPGMYHLEDLQTPPAETRLLIKQETTSQQLTAAVKQALHWWRQVLSN